MIKCEPVEATTDVRFHPSPGLPVRVLGPKGSAHIEFMNRAERRRRKVQRATNGRV